MDVDRNESVDPATESQHDRHADESDDGSDVGDDRDSDPGREVTEGELLKLLIRQLLAYGHTQLAATVAEQTGAPVEYPSNRLAELVTLGLQKEDEPDDSEEELKPTFATEGDPHNGQDDENDEDGQFVEVEGAEGNFPPNYRPLYTTAHKGQCTTAAYSPDGRYIATGSADTSLKVIDVGRCHRLNDRTGEPFEKPVIRTLYDHAAPVNEVAFHPNGLVLASCSDDQTIKLFDISKPGIKRAFRYLQDTHNVRSINFHPSGDFIVAGTDHNVVRVYDIKTLQCYTMSSDPTGLHQGAITQVKYAAAGNIFATSSTDGDVRIWDSVSGKCVCRIEKAHGGAPASSLRITRNGKYLLTGGRDSVIRLWEIGSGRAVHSYEGASQTTVPSQVTFSWNEKFVMSTDDVDKCVVFWDAHTGDFRGRHGGFGNIIRYIAASPTDPGFLTCSDDFRARYWNVPGQLDASGR